jgi:hypothetical protein
MVTGSATAMDSATATATDSAMGLAMATELA